MTTPVRGPVEVADRAAPGSADRLTRAIAFGFLPGGLVFGALVLPVVQAQWHLYPPAFTTIALTLVLAPTVLAGALAFRARIAVIRGLAVAALATGLLASAGLPLVVRPGLDADAPWTYDIAPIGVILGVVALPPGLVLGAAALEAVLLALDRAAAVVSPMPVLAVQDGAYALLFQTLFIALGAATLAAGRSADEAEAIAAESVAQAAADTARERERARVNALVHDRVLATLLSAAGRAPGSERITREDAARALHDLRALLGPDLPREPVPPQQVVWLLQGVTTDVAPEATFGWEVLAGATPLAPDAADALAAAAEEALRNSVRHADAQNRTVHVALDGRGVRVDVLDDGVGFDAAHLPATRLGIAESVLGRMRALPGGDAFVVSSPGVGTRVQLQVRRPG